MAKNYGPAVGIGVRPDQQHGRPRYNWITPNIHNDMHSSLKTDFAYNGVTYAAGTDEQQIALGDNFLSKIVPLIESSQVFRNNGLIVIWTDETEESPGCGSAEFTLAEIIISPLARGNAYTNSIAYSHSSDLRTLQEIFGVAGPKGYLGDLANVTSLTDLFKPGAIPLSLQNAALRQ